MTNQKSATVQLTKKELITLANALNEVLNGPEAIEAWEFFTRMGTDPAEAEQLLAKLNELLVSIKEFGGDP